MAVWDLFFIKGVSVLFRVGITLFQIMEEEILNCNDYADIFMALDKYGLKVSREQLLKTLYQDVKKKDIDLLRLKYRKEVFDLLTD